jgi:hypothetical protein
MNAFHSLRSPSITPSIRVRSPLALPLRSTFDPLRSPLLRSPLIPLERSNLAPGLERPAQFGSLGEGKGTGRNSPDYPAACVDIQAQADRTHAKPMPGDSTRGRDSFVTKGLHSTAANRQAHQRPSQRVYSLCNPQRFPTANGCTAPRRNSVRHQRLASARSSNSLCWGHIGRTMRARSASTPFTLVDAALAGPISMEGPNRIRDRGGWQGKWRSLRKCISSPDFAPPLSRTFRVPPQRLCTAAAGCRPW